MAAATARTYGLQLPREQALQRGRGPTRARGGPLRGTPTVPAAWIARGRRGGDPRACVPATPIGGLRPDLCGCGRPRAAAVAADDRVPPWGPRRLGHLVPAAASWTSLCARAPSIKRAADEAWTCAWQAPATAPPSRPRRRGRAPVIVLDGWSGPSARRCVPAAVPSAVAALVPGGCHPGAARRAARCWAAWRHGRQRHHGCEKRL